MGKMAMLVNFFATLGGRLEWNLPFASCWVSPDFAVGRIFGGILSRWSELDGILDEMATLRADRG
jgi:hypothetical protein